MKGRGLSDDRRYEFVIVGSGAGGATLACELSKRGKGVIVVERGRPQAQLGTLRDARRFYDKKRVLDMPAASKEGVAIFRTFMAGGTTVVSCGNAIRALERELATLGIHLDDEFAEAEKDMRVAPIAEKLLSEGSRRILSAAAELGYRMRLMPKVIDSAKCTRCGQCVFGCPNGAKWSAVEYLNQARQDGAHILYDTIIDRVLIENGKAKGVAGTGPSGRVEILADCVVLAAGGMGTPLILQASGIEKAGQSLFVDLFVNVYGITQESNQLHEPVMTIVNDEFHASKGFILSPFVNQSRTARFVEGGLRGAALSASRMLGIMVKTRDDSRGYVRPRRAVSKSLTPDDKARLRAGADIASEILVRSGAREKSIVVTKPQGAHPGGTAAIGTVVDNDLRTATENLFVCDASVFPMSPGLPPILTIVALAKRLATALCKG